MPSAADLPSSLAAAHAIILAARVEAEASTAHATLRGFLSPKLLIAIARLNDVDPQAWLADVLARIANLSQTRLPELLPWNWRRADARLAA